MTEKVLAEKYPQVKVSDGDAWLIFPDAMISIEGICRFGAPGPIVKRNLRKWRDGIVSENGSDKRES